MLNITNSEGELERQRLVYFDENRGDDEPIYEDVKVKRPFVPRHPPLIQASVYFFQKIKFPNFLKVTQKKGNLSARRVFGCISQKCRLSATFFEDDAANGPVLTSSLSRLDDQLILSELGEKSNGDVVRDDAEVVGYSKLDVLKDGNEEVVICSANGLTHILASNPNQEIIRYHHQKGVRFFTCGFDILKKFYFVLTLRICVLVYLAKVSIIKSP